MITCFFVKMNEVVLEVFSFVASRVGGVLVLNRGVGAVEVEFFSFLLRNEGKNEGLLTVSFFDAEALARFRLFSLCFRRNVVCRRSRLLAHGCCRASLCAWPAWYVGRTKGGGAVRRPDAKNAAWSDDLRKRRWPRDFGGERVCCCALSLRALPACIAPCLADSRDTRACSIR